MNPNSIAIVEARDTTVSSKDANVTIIITTKNRPEDLAKTLGKLLSLGLEAIPLILVDDGSDEETIDSSQLSAFSRVTVHRNSTSRGLVVNRNWMASVATTEFVLSLDDDSCFREIPNLEMAAAYMRQNPATIGLQFNNVEVSLAQTPVPRCPPYAVQTYTGFGHMLRRAEFLNLGGYREYFIHMCEERDFCQRAWQQGYRVELYPDIVVEHHRTSVARNTKRNAFFLIRNSLIYSSLNLPFWPFVLRVALILPWSIMHNISQPSLWRHFVAGWFAGLLTAQRRKSERRAMTDAQYSIYRMLPMSR